MPNLGQWLWYLLQEPGCPASFKEPAFDVVLVQAFGRNHLHDNDLANMRRFHDEHGGNDAHTLAWCRDHVEPGVPNRILAWHLMNIMHHHEVLAFAQWEVVAACPADWYAAHHHRVVCLWPPATPGQYFSTRDVLEKSFAEMRPRGRSRPLILAHAGQAMRVAMMIRKMTDRWPAVWVDLPDDFDRSSVQSWTRNRWAWMMHEFLARAHHIVHGWV